MRGLYIRIIEGVFILLVALGPVALFAFPVIPVRPFGGRVLLAPIPGANCPGTLEPTSPFNINPAAPFGMIGPFAETPGPQTVGQVVPGAWVLGLYLNTPIPECEVGIPPIAAPLPVYRAYLFGTSVPDLPI